MDKKKIPLIEIISYIITAIVLGAIFVWGRWLPEYAYVILFFIFGSTWKIWDAQIRNMINFDALYRRITGRQRIWRYIGDTYPVLDEVLSGRYEVSEETLMYLRSLRRCDYGRAISLVLYILGVLFSEILKLS